MADLTNSDAPATKDNAQARRRKKDGRDGRVSVWIAVVSAIGAVAAAVVAAVQVHEADLQNVLSEQQQLLQLTTTIAQQYADQTSATNEAAGALTGSARASALSTAGIAWTNELLAEGEAGAVLISDLSGQGAVASIEYNQIARALVTGQADAQALEYYRDAVNAPPKAPLTQADALRGEGTVDYDLGKAAAGHALMLQAAGVYSDNRDLTRVQIADGKGQSFAEDAWNEMEAGDCKTGVTEIAEAVKILAPVDGGNSTDQYWLYSDDTAIKQYCS